MLYLSQVKCEYETHVEGFKALLRLGEETYIGIGSNKTSAKDHAAEAALEIWSVKSTPEKKPQEKTPVTTLNEYCQKYKVRMFLELIFQNPSGKFIDPGKQRFNTKTQ